MVFCSRSAPPPPTSAVRLWSCCCTCSEMSSRVCADRDTGVQDARTGCDDECVRYIAPKRAVVTDADGCCCIDVSDVCLHSLSSTPRPPPLLYTTTPPSPLLTTSPCPPHPLHRRSTSSPHPRHRSALALRSAYPINHWSLN